MTAPATSSAPIGSPASSSTPGTRGKNENHIYFSTAEADPHRVLAPKATHPPTAVDILSQILRRDGAQVSAHSAAAAESDPFTRLLHAAAAMYSDALTAAAEHTAGAATMAHIDAAAVAIRANITDYGAWPVLRRNLALLAVDGHDPIEALHAAAATPWETPSTSPRCSTGGCRHRKVGRRAGRSAALAGGHPRRAGRTPPMGPLPARALQLVGDLADQIRAAARQWQPGTVPAWARPCWLSNPS